MPAMTMFGPRIEPITLSILITCIAQDMNPAMTKYQEEMLQRVIELQENIIKIMNPSTIRRSREEDEVSGFFVLSHLWMRGYFKLG